MMLIPHNPQIAGELKSRIDACEFGLIKRYFRDPSSEISSILIVQDPYKLEEVGAFLVDLMGHGGLSTGMDIFIEGAVVAGVDDFDGVDPEMHQNARLLDGIADDEICDVLFLPPIYLVKFRRP
jgi:hypothetical protein